MFRTRTHSMASLVTACLCAILTCTTWADQAVLHMEIGDPTRKDKEVELRLDGITDTSTGDIITLRQLAERLADIGLLFVGETHTNLDFHDAQLKVIQELHRAGREVMIGLEMFPYPQQPLLDDWIDGLYTEQGFVELAEWYTYWGYRWEYYRDIFLFARDNDIRMYGINSPREVVKAVRKNDFKDLSPEDAKHFLHEVQPVTDDQRRMFKGFFEADDALHMNEEAMEGMLRAQTTWDATMGWNSLQALQDHGGEDAIMVVLIGSGHVTYGLGAERQTAPYYDGKIASVIPLEIMDDEDQPVKTVQASYANFVWGLPSPLDTVYPTLGISLMGKLGNQPTRLIQVGEGSVAERAGLIVGDVLLRINDQPIDSAATLRLIFAPTRWGDVLTALIERGGQEQELEIPIRRNTADQPGY
ncbi:MAG: ChaN family lipoprotein [Gammaproteobacteria bacterium]|nr:ChaN family lipoprotein [Gammaproteobacteria bacterium]